MKSSHSQILIQLIFDILAILVAYFAIYYMRFESGLYSSSIKPGLFEIVLGSIIFIIFWITLFFFSGMYKNWYERSPFNEIWKVLNTVLIGCAIIVFAVTIDSSSSPRQLYILNVVILFSTTFIGRTSGRIIEKRLRRNRILTIPSLIIGTFKRSAIFYNKCYKSPSWGYKPFGIVLFDKYEQKDESKIDNCVDVPIIGFLENLTELVEKYNPEEIIITTDDTDHNKVINIVSFSSDYGIRVKIEPDLYDIFTGQAKTQMLYGIPLIEIRTQLMKPWQEVIKRIFDIIFSFLIIVIGMPIWLIVGLLVKLDSSGPMFYTQPRIGKNGKVFNIFKFRSMSFEPVPKDQKWTSKNDPRVTKFGKFIRKTHLDEIPQFLNVLLGDMSVVGPRPEQPKFVEEFSKQLPYYGRRHKVRPGITGWWQVTSTGYELNLDEVKSRIKDDFYYIENMSIKLDIEIIIRTVWCVLTGHGQA
jgi:exopolysaccharide biosynthesis polyprenyl glycosylphosphotransferase